jgi:hypothetical protein
LGNGREARFPHHLLLFCAARAGEDSENQTRFEITEHFALY